MSLSQPKAEQPFSSIPVLIQTERMEHGEKTVLHSKDDAFSPLRQTVLKTVVDAADSEYPFTRYHYHDGIELLLVNEGEATVIVNNLPFRASEGDILVFNTFEAHGIYISSQNTDFSCTCIVFRPHYFFPPEEEGGENHFFFDLKSILFENRISSKMPAYTEILSCINRILSLHTQKKPGWTVEIFSVLLLFYSSMIRFGLYKHREENAPYMFDFMNKVTSYIEENLDQDISTTDIAAFCQYSTEHFCRLFKKCFNKTFKDYLNFYRIRKAKEFIDRMDFTTIAEVSSRFGFNNQNHFGHMFKKYVGFLPSEYIQLQKNNNK